MIQYCGFASMAEASYVDFSKVDLTTETQIKAALQPPVDNQKNLIGSFSAAQAADFVSKWTVKGHLLNTDNGYSSTALPIHQHRLAA